MNTHSLDIEKSSSQCAYVNDSAVLDLGATFTLEAWLKAESLPSDGANHAFIGKWQTTGDNRSYVFRLNNTGGTYTLQMVADANGAVGSSTIISSNALTVSTGNWYHFAVSVSSGTCSFYHDAVAKGGAAGLATPFNGAAAFVIGAERSDGTDGWDGLIDEVRVWNTARTQQNISDYKDTELVGNESGLVGYWKLNNDYQDSTSNNNDLTGVNTPTFSTDVPFTGTITISVSETSTGTESSTNLRGRLTTISETSSATENVSSFLGKIITILENTNISETLSVLRAMVASVADTSTATEVLVKIKKKITNIVKNTATGISNRIKGTSSIKNQSKS